MSSSSTQTHFTKLRTKGGCVNCRDRRKKCDERKPVCAACQRLGFKCQWPNPSSLEDRRERGAANSRWSPTASSSKPAQQCSKMSISIAKAPMSSPTPTIQLQDDVAPNSFLFSTSHSGIRLSAQIFLRSNREQLLLSYYFESFLPANILPKAHANFSRLYLGEVPELMDSMFACSSVKLANISESPPVEALKYYTRAVSGLRKRLDAGEVTGLEDWLLVVTILLHCFETWRCDTSDSTLSQPQHLLGAIQLLKMRCTNPVSEVHSDLYVLMAESVLFHVSTLLASSQSFAILDVDNSLWEWMEAILQRPTYHNVPPPANHPVLGTPWTLNKLVFEISRLSVRISPTASDKPEQERLGAELSKWEEIEEFYSGVDVCRQEDPYMNVRQLYIICARVLLLWVEAARQDIEASDFENQVRAQKVRAMAILRGMENKCDDSWNFLMRWPLLILGHMVDSQSEKGLVQNSLERIWARSSCGDVKRCLDKMQCFWDGGSLGMHESKSGWLLRGWS